MKRILLTGGLGFIGSNYLRHASQDPDTYVTIIDRRSIDKALSFNPDVDRLLSNSYGNSVRLINSDLADCDLANMISEFDIVIHLAANTGVQPSIANPHYDFSQNVQITFDILEAIRHCSPNNRPSLIFSSSVAPLAGNSSYPLNPNLPFKPLSPYGASKASCECYITSFLNSYQIESTILRFSNVYGPGSLGKTSVVSSMIREALLIGVIHIHGSGEQVRDFVHVDDLCNIIHYSIEYPHVDEPLHVCTGQPTSIYLIAHYIKSLIELYTGEVIHIAYLPALHGDAMTNFSCNQPLSKLPVPSFRSVDANSLSSTIQFFLRYRQLLT